MQLPYTQSPLDAVMIAHSAVGATLTAIVWRKPLRPLLASFMFLAAVWLAVSIPVEPDFWRGVGGNVGPDHVARVLKLSSMVAVASMIVARPRWIAVVAIMFKLGLNYAIDHVVDSNFELAGLHLLAFGILLGLHHLSSPRTFAPPLAVASRERSYARHDLYLFVLGTALATFVCFVVLDHFNNSGDEWANTFQADLFSHGKTYAKVPECPSLFQNYWVFFYQGRAFAQYTPGWPLLLAPFQRLGVAWLAAPLLLGITAVAVARLARRCVSGDATVGVHHERVVAAAGIIAGVLSVLGVSMLLNAGSRFPHLMVCAGFAWSVEGVCAVTARRAAGIAMSRGRQWGLGILVGSATSLLIAARPGDGGTLGFGIFLYFVYALTRGRVTWRSFVGTALAFGAWGALCLVILHAQLGVWLKTGYDIAGDYWGWARPKMSLPLPNQFKYGIPLATGSYCWWPCAPSLGAAGLVAGLRGPGRRAALMLGCGASCMTIFYMLLEFGRTADSGYGPRFYLPLVVPMAVGGGALLAPVCAAAWSRFTTRSAFYAAAPATVVALAVLGGVIRIGSLVYPVAHQEVHKRSAPMRAIEKEHVHHAVVSVTWGDVTFDPLDLTQNLPSDPDPDVVIVIQRHNGDDECGRRKYADRYFYRAYGLDEAKLIPYEN